MGHVRPDCVRPQSSAFRRQERPFRSDLVPGLDQSHPADRSSAFPALLEHDSCALRDGIAPQGKPALRSAGDAEGMEDDPVAGEVEEAMRFVLCPLSASRIPLGSFTSIEHDRRRPRPDNSYCLLCLPWTYYAQSFWLIGLGRDSDHVAESHSVAGRSRPRTCRCLFRACARPWRWSRGRGLCHLQEGDSAPRSHEGVHAESARLHA